VIGYLACHTHRVDIANTRLLGVARDQVTFSTKNGKTATVHPVDFLHRLVQHVLPPGFLKIRHSGLYGSL